MKKTLTGDEVSERRLRPTVGQVKEKAAAAKSFTQ